MRTPPDMKLSSSYIRTRFQNFFTSPSVTSFLRGEFPPKKNPGSAPDVNVFNSVTSPRVLSHCCVLHFFLTMPVGFN